MFINWFERMVPMLDSDNGGDGGERPKPADLLAQYSGDSVRMADKLAEVLRDNFTLRDKNRTLTTERDVAQGKVPADGSLVLSGDDVTHWQAYQQLGKPDELTARLTDGDTAKSERDQLRRSMTIRQVAEVAGYHADVLEQLDHLKGGLTYTVKDTTETRNGKQEHVKKPFVHLDGKDVLLSEYADTEWKLFLPSLAVAPAQPDKATGTPPRDPQHKPVPPPGAEDEARRGQANLYRTF